MHALFIMRLRRDAQFVTAARDAADAATTSADRRTLQKHQQFSASLTITDARRKAQTIITFNLNLNSRWERTTACAGEKRWSWIKIEFIEFKPLENVISPALT